MLHYDFWLFLKKFVFGTNDIMEMHDSVILEVEGGVQFSFA